MEPFFTVVIPVHNKASCLRRSVESVLKQSIGDFELLLIDDASTDLSLNEMQHFTDARIRILVRDTPGAGGYAARNLGIREARGEWIAFLDADDEWSSDHLDVLRGLTRESLARFISTGWLNNYDGGVLRPSRFAALHGPGTIRLNLASFLRECVNDRVPVWTGATAVRRDLIRETGGFPEDCRRGGDTAAWLRLMTAAGDIVVSGRQTALYHRVDSSVTRNTPAEVRDNCVFRACKELMKEAPTREIVALLMRLSNFHVSYGLRKRAVDGSLRFSDCNAHYFRANWKHHILFRLHSLAPRRMQPALWASYSRFKRLVDYAGHG
jgi:glycosyltransferase involved in cell wall biosynthesis